MKILIQSARVINPESSYHLKEKNILIHDGRIASIGDKNFSADQVIKARGMILSAGWFDLGTYCGDPGLEHKEDLTSVARAAQAGGFTEIALLPNTVPAVQTKNEVTYLTRNNGERLVRFHPLASVTRNNKGEELTEMIDLYRAGAVGFTDGLKSIWHTDIFLKALQYLQPFNGVLIDHAEDSWLNMFGQMHEGVNSTRLGLKGMPRLAEEIAINKHLELLAYAGGRLHFARVSTARSVDMIRAARKRLKITCDCASYQPLLDDGMLGSFDTNYKVNPPLRERADADALIKGLKDGTIDVICSAHTPQDEESKNLEFDMADFGMIGLQTLGSNLVSLSRHLDWEVLIEKVTAGPRKVLGMANPLVEEDQVANLTLFDPNHPWKFGADTNVSKSRNSPWFNQDIKGKSIAVFNNGKYALQH